MTLMAQTMRPPAGPSAARPMLARVASSIYWMSRYVERAEHIARLLFVTTTALPDVVDFSPRLREQLWNDLLVITGSGAVSDLAAGQDGPLHAELAMAFGSEHANSLESCITKARENTRSIREMVSVEMWEALNQLYWTIRAENVRDSFAESSESLYRQVIDASILFQGLADQTMSHTQPWLFVQLGRYIERIDMTCRVLERRYRTIESSRKDLEAPIRNMLWITLLRSCCCLEAYRRRYGGELDPNRIAQFVIFDAHYPRCLRYCVEHARECVLAAREYRAAGSIDDAERTLGRLAAELEFADHGALRRTPVEYLQVVRQAIADTASAIHHAHFLKY